MKLNPYTVQRILTTTLLFILAVQGRGEELSGKVVNTNGKQVSIKLEGDLFPQIGDTVTIGFMMDSVGFIPLKGKWEVTGMDPDTITADPFGETKQPQNEQLVKINCTTPQTIQALNDKANELDKKGEDFFYGRNGQEKNYAKAMELYLQAAKYGSAESMVSIGYLYANALAVKKDEAEAVKWFHKAAKQDLATAQSNLGFMYECGKGVEVDMKEAARWYKKSAAQDYATAQGRLGVLYYRGHGVEKDLKEAVRLFHLAAEKDYAAAQKNLAVLYEKGEGVPKNKEEAIRWYRKAADNGNESAKRMLLKMKK